MRSPFLPIPPMLRRCRKFLLLFGAWWTAFTFPSLRAEPFQDGLVAWDSGDPAAAAQAFQLALDRDGPSAGAYYNLGLALLQTDRPVEALAALLRARALDPASAPIHAALEHLVGSQSGWTLPRPPNWVQVARRTGLGILYVAGSVGTWVGLALLATGLLRRQNKLAWMAPGLAGTALGLVLLTWAGASDPLFTEKNWAVLQSSAPNQKVSLRASPVESAGAMEKLSAGVVVEEISQRAGWSYCRLPSGREGWVPTSSLLRLFPGPES